MFPVQSMAQDVHKIVIASGLLIEIETQFCQFIVGILCLFFQRLLTFLSSVTFFGKTPFSIGSHLWGHCHPNIERIVFGHGDSYLPLPVWKSFFSSPDHTAFSRL